MLRSPDTRGSSRPTRTRRQWLLEAAAALLVPAAGVAREHDTPGDWRIGLTPVILSDQAAFLQRWADYLQQRLGAPVHFIVHNDYRRILDRLFDRDIDAAWVCGFPYVLYQSQLELVATPLCRGTPTYQAYLITRPNSPIRGWEDLPHHVLAYADPLSNSGWLVAQEQLARAGVSPNKLLKSFFAHGHRHVIEAVAVGLADAGSVDGYVWDTLRAQGWAPALATQVVWRSEPYGFPPLVMLASEPATRKAALRNVLLSMARDAQGRALLAELMLDGFVQTSPELYGDIARLTRRHAPVR